MNAMPQLNEAETKFFESGGQELAPVLSEGKPEEEAAREGAAETDWTPTSAGVTKKEEAGEKTEKGREGKFVPL